MVIRLRLESDNIHNPVYMKLDIFKHLRVDILSEIEAIS
jgi:hypothetical protein